MFKNAVIARATGLLNILTLASIVTEQPFVACGPTQTKSAGFVPPRGEGDVMVESIGGQLILALQTQTKSVPAAEVKKRLELALDKIEAETGRRPKGKRAKEVKEEVIHELLPKAFPKDRKNTIWIDPQDGLVVIEANSWAQADEVITRLAEICAGVKFSALATHINPVTAMASWLLMKEAPAGFTVDRECELKQPDGEKAVVRYSRHTLDTDQVGEHIRQGKLPTRLAITWGGRVSLVLTESMVLKKVELLDVALEAASKEEKADAFDADVALHTGELHAMVADLTAALGGEVEPAPGN